MGSIIDQIPDVEVLLAMEPEELAFRLLTIAVSKRHQNGTFLEQDAYAPGELFQMPGQFGRLEGRGYPRNKEDEVHLALAEAWQWLRQNLLVVPAPEPASRGGWMLLSRKGKKVIEQGNVKDLLDSLRFPKVMIHHSLMPEVWFNLIKGELDTAVFLSFRELEIAIRSACLENGKDFSALYGIELARKAFHPETGPLSSKTDAIAERDGLQQLMAGSLSSYKNPHSHRHVNLESPSEAFEMVVLASHLLRVVDSRTAPEKLGS